MQELSDNDIDTIAARTAEKLTASYKQLWIDRETHYNDHIWVADQKRRQEEIAAMRRKVISSAAIWALLLVVGFVATASWKAVLEAIRANVG